MRTTRPSTSRSEVVYRCPSPPWNERRHSKQLFKVHFAEIHDLRACIKIRFHEHIDCNGDLGTNGLVRVDDDAFLKSSELGACGHVDH